MKVLIKGLGFCPVRTQRSFQNLEIDWSFVLLELGGIELLSCGTQVVMAICRDAPLFRMKGMLWNFLTMKTVSTAEAGRQSQFALNTGQTATAK